MEPGVGRDDGKVEMPDVEEEDNADDDVAIIADGVSGGGCC